MNKFKPLFDIPLAKYDNMDEYPPADEIKRALEAHLVNHPNAPKKPTASGNAPATANSTTAGKGNKPKNKKRKRDEDKDKPSKSSNRSSSSQASSRSVCPTCKRSHSGRCWVEHPEDIPEDMREWWGKRNKENKNKDNNKGKSSQ